MATVITSGPRAVVRGGPGATFPVVGHRTSGDVVQVVERTSGWARVGTHQWIDRQLLREAEEGTAGRDVVPHPHLGHASDPHWRMLVNFPSSGADLRPGHRAWLMRTAASQARAGQRVWLRGFASRLGDSGHNSRLAARRSQAVRDFLVREGQVPAARITGVASVGESWSHGSETDDSGMWRAVEVILTSGTIHGPEFFFGGASPLSSTFLIKFVGGGGGGLGLQADAATFVIRTPNDYWHRYLYAGGGVGAGAGPGLPFSWAQPAARGRGWVGFTTRVPVTVQDFAGTARITQGGVQFGPVGAGTYQLGIQNATALIEVPTGSGFGAGAGVSATVGRFEAAGDARHDRNWEAY